jgi:hypothetical protein
MPDLDQWREWLSDPAFGPERMDRLRAAKHGNRAAFESIREDYKMWKAMQPKYPDVLVWLDDDDGSANFIVSRVAGALHEAGAAPAEVEAFRDECISGDHDDPLGICMRWAELVL